MKLQYIKDLLTKHPYWNLVKNNNAVVEIAYGRLSNKLDEIIHLNEESKVPFEGQHPWQLTQFSRPYIEEVIKEEPYLKELTSNQRTLVYQMASQRISELLNATTSDAYYVDSIRPGIVQANPNTSDNTLLKTILNPILKLVTVWYDREYLSTILKPFVKVYQRFTNSYTLTSLLNVYVVLKEIVTQGHILNTTLAVYLRIRDAFTKTTKLSTKFYPILSLVIGRLKTAFTMKSKLSPYLRVFNNLITETKITVGTKMAPTLKLK